MWAPLIIVVVKFKIILICSASLYYIWWSVIFKKDFVLRYFIYVLLKKIDI